MRTQKDRKLKGVWKNETETNWNGVTYERSNGREEALYKIKKTPNNSPEKQKNWKKKFRLSIRKFSFRLAAAAAAPELLESRRTKTIEGQ